jgi:transposase, IS30 family
MQSHLTVEQRQLALRLKARGRSLREIGPQVGCAFQTVARIARRGSRRPVRLDGWVPGPGRLTLADREEITPGLHAGESFTVIAAQLGKAVSTVSREVAANGGRGACRAWRAQQRARQQARRPKTPKLACPQLAAQVTGWLEEWWSPQQISRRLRIEFPGDPMMWVSHETIYQALYVQGRGELRRELARCLRTGRRSNRPCAKRSLPCPPVWPAPSPGTRASRWPATPASPSPPASRSTSATPTHPGSAARTRTPTACCASTCPKAPTCHCTPPPAWPA